MLNALIVANTFLNQAFKENISISPMKLQKIVYIFYKEYLKKTGERIFPDTFEVWQYGPVIPTIYNAFKSYRARPINDYYRNQDNSYTTVSLVDNSVFFQVFYDVWGKYKNIDGISLSKLTHQENTAWSKALKNNKYILDDLDIFNEVSYV